jgi:Flp pilus assembly protein TadD
MAHNNLSGLLIPEGRYKEALRHSEEALRLKPDYVEACYNSAIALEKMGRMRDAIVRYSEALRIKPGDALIYNNLAWLLATIPAIEGGDAVRAVALAQRACELTGNRRVPYLDTLAVAYAAGGDFKQAIVTIEGAIGLAHSSGQTQFIEEMTSHLDLFRHGKTYRRPAAASASSHP